MTRWCALYWQAAAHLCPEYARPPVPAALLVNVGSFCVLTVIWESPMMAGDFDLRHSDKVDKAASMIGTSAADAPRVADAMSAAWLAFARTGNPN